jgi:prolyl 4-hydroxylase
MQTDADAEHLLAVMAISDLSGPPDPLAALTHLQRAAELGHRSAQAELAALAGNWRLVDDVNAGKPQGADTWARLRQAVDVGALLKVPDGAMLSAQPRIATVKGFATPQLCDWLVRLGRPHLAKATVYDQATGALRQDGSRSNSAAEMNLERSDTVLGFLRLRIAALAEVRPLALEMSQVLNYQIGEQFRAHYDFLDVRFPGHASDVAQKGQRGLTLLIYLNDDYDGGETAFPQLGRAFRGAKGDALVFWNITEDGAPDFRTQHIGTAPTRGEKWLFSQWIRVRAA